MQQAAIPAPLDPRIGLLNSGRYYCFPQGHAHPEFTGTLSEVEAQLGIGRGSSAPVQPAKPSNLARRYRVTVTPRIPVFAGAWSEAEHEVEVLATSHAAAISQVRNQRRETDGRHAVPASYRAVLAP